MNKCKVCGKDMQDVSFPMFSTICSLSCYYLHKMNYKNEIKDFYRELNRKYSLSS